MNALIEAKNLKKYFQTARGTLYAVDDVSFTLNEGETLGIVGESGCGKSTLGRITNHLLPMTSGKILFDGKDVTNITKKELAAFRKDAQMIFQDPFSSLNPRMTISQTIAEPLIIFGERDKKVIENEVTRIMDLVGLDQRLRNAYPHELDGGRRQRVGIARALILKPRFIVCDEPVSALDVSIQAQILNLMMDLQEKMNLSYVFITHDLSVVRHISDHIMVMYLGKAVEKCSAEALFEKPLHPYTQALLSAVPVASIHYKKNRILMQGEVTSPIDPPKGCRFASRCRFATERCFKESPCMKEVEPNHFVACHNFD